MAQGRLEDSWERTAWVVAMVHNVNCAKKSDLREPSSFNPYRRRGQPPRARADRSVGKIPLKKVADVFVRGMRPKGV